MPIGTPEAYADMLDRAKSGGFAYPAINCTSSETINAALKGFADAGSDGIIQFSTGGAEFGCDSRLPFHSASGTDQETHIVADDWPGCGTDERYKRCGLGSAGAIVIRRC